MNILVLCIISVILSMVSFVYYTNINEEENNIEFKNKLKKTVKEKTTVGYICVMLLVLIVMSIYLEKMFFDNTLVHNAKLIVLVALIFAVALIDYRKHIIPNKIILVGILLRFVFYVIELIIYKNDIFRIITNDLYAFLIVVAFFVIGVVIMRNALGMGDIKLMLLMCLYQGFFGVVSSLFFSLFVSFVIAVVMLISRKKSRKDVIPFAPSILVGTIISIFLTGI